MKTLTTKVASFLFVVSFLLCSSVAFAQGNGRHNNGNGITGANGNGNGAYVSKQDIDHYMETPLVPFNMWMTQTKFLVTPSGKGTAIWVATITPEQAAVTAPITTASWGPVNELGGTYMYSSECVVSLDGSVKLTLTGEKQ